VSDEFRHRQSPIKAVISQRSAAQQTKRRDLPRNSNQPHQGTASHIAAANIATQALSRPSSRNEVQRSKRSGEIPRELAISHIKERPPILRQQISQHKPIKAVISQRSAAQQTKWRDPPRISNQPHQGTASNIAAANIATQAYQSRHLATKCSAANEVKRSPQN